MSKKNKKFIIFDGNALLHRSFHALPPLSTKSGQLVNAVYGFTTVLLKVLKEFKPAYVAVAFDKRGKTFRHQEYAEYKAGRVKQPDEFYDQFPITKQVIDALGIPVFEIDGYEADDIIGTVVTANQQHGLDNVIVTGDKDTFQLITDKTSVYTMRKGIADTVTYDTAAVEERYGLSPEQMIDLKAIAGDPSDNIPGVKGIGEKGAIDLLKKFGTLERLYTEIDQKGEQSKIPPRYFKLLRDQRQQALQSKQLVTIVRDVPIDYSVEACQIKPYDPKKVFALFRELEFKSLLGRLPTVGGSSNDERHELHEQEGEKAAAERREKEAKEALVIEQTVPVQPIRGVTVKYRLVDADADFAEFITAASKQTAMTIDTESTSVDPFRAKLLGVSFSWTEGEGWYLNVHQHPTWLPKLKQLLENTRIQKFGHNLKYDIAMLRQAGIELQPASFDSMIASYLLNPGSRGHGLDTLAFEVFGYQMQPITDLIGKGKQAISMEAVPVEKVSWYSCEDADYTHRLCGYFKPELEEKNLAGLMEKIEMPLVPVLAQMEQNGVKIDTDFLGTLSHEVGAKLETLEEKIYREAKGTFNINSPLQLKKILFEKLEISTEGIGKTKTGISTAAAELDKLKHKHPIIPFIQDYRELSKLQSTYLEALPKLVNPKTGRVYTSFNQTVAATGRLSSSEPNFQNIPIRTDEGKKIRKAFIADRGNRILSADYSQIELRIIASLANDERMIESFQQGEDIHRRTAAEVNGIPLDQVTDQQRYEAKEVNFGIIYGMGAWGLASRQGMSRERARAFIEKYFSIYSKVQEYLAVTMNLAHEQGYVETLFGRRRYLPEINSSMQQVRAQAERMAVNMPVQGTAADLLKLAMITIQQKLPKVSPKTKMILQVHDELVFEVPSGEVEVVAKFVAKEMNTVHTLQVPIKTEVAAGRSWGDLEEIIV